MAQSPGAISRSRTEVGPMEDSIIHEASSLAEVRVVSASKIIFDRETHGTSSRQNLEKAVRSAVGI